jgi:cullin 3
MEGLLREYNLSIEMTKEFREMHKDSIPELNASVFTFTFWPLKVNHYGLRNEALTRVVNRFAGYYSTKHSGRKLTWIFQSGSADIQCKYPSGNYEFNTSTYAMILLTSIFNKLKENERIKLSSIEQETGIEKRELIRTMQSISLGKYRIINKLSKGKEITDDDEFCINQKFTSTLAKFKIATIAQSSAEVDPYEQNKKTLESSRKSQTEACIVRIMKSRKVLSHNDLLIQVAVQLGAKFQPEPKDVKSRIEALIEREYIERDQTDRNVYHYLA